MILKTFRNVSRFQIFVPERQGWLYYRPDWSQDGVWFCEFDSQDTRRIEKRRLITAAYAEEIWHRFKSQDTCETYYLASIGELH